jgi:hypothetical protein
MRENMVEQKSPNHVEIDYRLTGAGWAECDVTIGTQHASTSASYLRDALGELTGAIVELKNGAVESMAQFAEEPGEYRWRFYRNGDQLRVLILSFYDIEAGEPDEKGQVVLDAPCSFTAFTSALVAALKRILDEHGVEGYRSEWGEDDFPMDSYNQLRF